METRVERKSTEAKQLNFQDDREYSVKCYTNTILISGAQSLEVFVQIIDAELEAIETE